MEGPSLAILLCLVLPSILGLEYDDRLFCSIGLVNDIKKSDNYVWCKKGQMCATTSFVIAGAKEYHLGCMTEKECAAGSLPDDIKIILSAATNVTTKCCDKMGCNGMKGEKDRQLCSSCTAYQVTHAAACSTVKLCERHEQCFYQKVYASSTNQILHEMNCQRDQVCDILAKESEAPPRIVGRSVESTLSLMSHCCKGDLCNLGYAMVKNNLTTNSSWNSHHSHTTQASTQLTTQASTIPFSPSSHVTTHAPASTPTMPVSTLFTAASTVSPTKPTPPTRLSTPMTEPPSTQTEKPTTTTVASTMASINTASTMTPTLSTTPPAFPSGHICHARSPGGPESTITCQSREPYCLSHIVNYADGQREIIKGCTSRAHCLSFFHMDSAKCANLDNTTLYEDLICSFCCTKNYCNAGMVPPVDSQFVEPTTTTTTPAPTTTTTLPSTTRKPKPTHVNCYTCSNCGIHRAVLYTCHGASPFCMTEFTNYPDGYRVYNKRCASSSECNTLWYQQSKQRRECAEFDPNKMYSSNFICHFCCTEDECNNGSRPPNNTMYIP